jgi:hypothetical protein
VWDHDGRSSASITCRSTRSCAGGLPAGVPGSRHRSSARSTLTPSPTALQSLEGRGRRTSRAPAARRQPGAAAERRRARNAQAMAGHGSPRTRELYDRPGSRGRTSAPVRKARSSGTPPHFAASRIRSGPTTAHMGLLKVNSPTPVVFCSGCCSLPHKAKAEKVRSARWAVLTLGV